LAALRKLALIDTPGDEAFDRLGRLAAKHLKTPIALVTLVEEDRQFFKSCLGLPEPWNSWRQTPLTHSFCQHVVATGAPLVIPDARQDPAFQDNPAIIDLGVIAYLGIPLITSDQQVLGSFCVIDSISRIWTEEDVEIVRDFAALVMDAIELRELKRALEHHIAEGSISWHEQARELRIAEERFHLVTKATNDCVWDWDLETNSLWWNEGITVLFGYDQKEVGSRIEFWYDHIHPEDRDRVVAGIHADIDAKKPYWADQYRFLRVDGTIAHVYDRGYIVFDQKKDAVRMVGAMMDISERLKAEETIRSSEERFRTVTENASDVILNIDENNMIRYANPSLERVLGYRPEEVVGQSITVLMPAEFRSKHVAGMSRYIRTGEKRLRWESLEIVGLHKAGHTVPLEISFGETRKGNMRHFTGVLRDISERKRAVDVLRESEERYRSIIEGASYGIYVTSMDGSIMDCNPAFAALLGYSSRDDLLGTNIRKYWKDPAQREALATGSPENLCGVEVDWLTAKGEPIIVRLSSRKVTSKDKEVRFETLVEDITQRRRLELQFQQLQKIEALGRLAAGVAHDFNNLLMIISGQSCLMLDGLQEPKLRSSAQAILTATEHGAALTAQLLAFGRQQVVERKNLKLRPLIASILTSLPRLIGPQIKIVQDLGNDDATIHASSVEIEQIILNLATNARDAMPEGGTFSVAIQNREIDQGYVAQYPFARTGPFVELSITDTGMGMDQKTQASAFEPFFTTKSIGKGTGLGLASVYGIVKQNNGWITLSTKLTAGTKFEIYFPRSPASAEITRPVAANTQSLHARHTILLVEDEPGLRDVMVELLQRIGHEVLQAGNGTDGLRIAQQHPEIKMVITDIEMRGMSGQEMAKRLCRQRPDIKIIFTSGFSADWKDVRADLPSARHLQKPFTLTALQELILDVLAGQD